MEIFYCITFNLSDSLPPRRKSIIVALGLGSQPVCATINVIDSVLCNQSDPSFIPSVASVVAILNERCCCLRIELLLLMICHRAVLGCEARSKDVRELGALVDIPSLCACQGRTRLNFEHSMFAERRKVRFYSLYLQLCDGASVSSTYGLCATFEVCCLLTPSLAYRL